MVPLENGLMKSGFVIRRMFVNLSLQ